MGSARVQYELERTLPSLQLAAIHGLFSQDIEIRSITQRRRQYENALIRRHALSGDFVQYIKYEEELERLRAVRVNRLKDLNKIPRSDMIKMQKEAIAHIVSIFERGVRRLRFDLELWKYYIQWAHSRKMRVVQSRVSARALALFPNKVEMWLIVANYELNDYQSASTSRALLQRGIRLNSISHHKALQVQREDRLSARSKTSKSDVNDKQGILLEITNAGNEDEDTATLLLSEAEKQLIRLWIGYIRMELVFMERLRRRRIVLGIASADAVADFETGKEEFEARSDDDFASEQVSIQNDDEVVPMSINSMKIEVQPIEASDALMQGSIPKSALRSAISMQSPSSLPPRSHFAFLLALLNLFRSFPFCEDTLNLRNSLVEVVHTALKRRFPNDSNVLLLISANQLQQSAVPTLSEMEAKEEISEGVTLKKVSNLTLSEVDDFLYKSKRDEDREDADDVFTLAFSIFARHLDVLDQTIEVATNIKDIVEYMRSETLLLLKPNEKHFWTQLLLLRSLQMTLQKRGLDKTLAPYLKACFKRVLQDAKKAECEGPQLEVEKCRSKLSDAKEAEDKNESSKKAVKVERDIFKSCQLYPNRENLLIVYAETLLFCIELKAISVQDLDTKWQKIITQKIGRQSVAVWKLWCKWVASSNDDLWKTEKMQASLLHTIYAPAAHEQLLQFYFSSATSRKEAIKRIAFIEKKAFTRSSFWRWAINRYKQNTGDSINNLDSRTLLEHLYSKLCQSSEDVEDCAHYFKFLMMTLNESSRALDAFKDAQNRFAKDVNKKMQLEQIWTELNIRVRQNQNSINTEAD